MADPLKIVTLMLRKGQLFTVRCAFCDGALEPEPKGNGLMTVPACRKLKCQKAAGVIQ